MQGEGVWATTSHRTWTAGPLCPWRWAPAGPGQRDGETRPQRGGLGAGPGPRALALSGSHVSSSPVPGTWRGRPGGWGSCWQQQTRPLNCWEREAGARSPAAAASCRKPPPLRAGPRGHARAELQRGSWEAAIQGGGIPGTAVPLFLTPGFHLGLMQFQV